jgi:hypothetical protein
MQVSYSTLINTQPPYQNLRSTTANQSRAPVTQVLRMPNRRMVHSKIWVVNVVTTLVITSKESVQNFVAFLALD